VKRQTGVVLRDPKLSAWKLLSETPPYSISRRVSVGNKVNPVGVRTALQIGFFLVLRHSNLTRAAILAGLILLSPGFAEAQGTDASRCITCHPREVSAFENSAMGRSVSKEASQPDGHVDHTLSHSTVTIGHRGQQMTQRVDADGLRVDYPVAYAVGAGKAGFSYLIQLGDYLFQSPVSFYNQAHAWDVTPGYEPEPVLDFTHPIAEGCIFCHAATPKLAAGTENRFLETLRAISCERCHGSAEAHLKEPVRGSILNPAKMPTASRDSVCEQCHLEGAVRVLNPEKRWSDFQPGQTTESVFVTYVEHTRKSEGVKAVSQTEQLALSRCARESAGRLWCGSCHDPHGAASDRKAEVRNVCMGCHADVFAAAQHKPAEDCVSCHMPRMRPSNIAHTAITDHLIRVPGARESAAPSTGGLVAWRQPEKGLATRDLGLALFESGVQEKKNNDVVRSYDLLKDLPMDQRSDPDVLAALGSVLLAQNRKDFAEKLYSGAVAARPRNARFAFCLGAVYAAQGNTQRAVEQLRRSITLDPSDPEPYRKLAAIYRDAGNAREANAVLAEYLDFMPQNVVFRRLVGQHRSF